MEPCIAASPPPSAAPMETGEAYHSRVTDGRGVPKLSKHLPGHVIEDAHLREGHA